MKNSEGQSDHTEDVRPLPFGPIFLALIMSALLLVGLGGRLQQSVKEFDRATRTKLRLQELRGQSVHLDEVLTMSARMGAATGDLVWEERYLMHVPKLDDALAEAQSLMPQAFTEQGTAQTDEANQKLIAMETKAFDLVRNGETEPAQSLLASDAYQFQKTVYADGMNLLLQDLI